MQHKSPCDDDIGPLWVPADHIGAFDRAAAHEQIKERFQALPPQYDQRTRFAIPGGAGVGLRESRNGTAAAEGHGKFLFLNSPNDILDLVLDVLA